MWSVYLSTNKATWKRTHVLQKCIILSELSQNNPCNVALNIQIRGGFASLKSEKPSNRIQRSEMKIERSEMRIQRSETRIWDTGLEALSIQDFWIESALRPVSQDSKKRKFKDHKVKAKMTSYWQQNCKF